MSVDLCQSKNQGPDTRRSKAHLMLVQASGADGRRSTRPSGIEVRYGDALHSSGGCLRTFCLLCMVSCSVDDVM